MNQGREEGEGDRDESSKAFRGKERRLSSEQSVSFSLWVAKAS